MSGDHLSAIKSHDKRRHASRHTPGRRVKGCLRTGCTIPERAAMAKRTIQVRKTNLYIFPAVGLETYATPGRGGSPTRLHRRGSGLRRSRSASISAQGMRFRARTTFWNESHKRPTRVAGLCSGRGSASGEAAGEYAPGSRVALQTLNTEECQTGAAAAALPMRRANQSDSNNCQSIAAK